MEMIGIEVDIDLPKLALTEHALEILGDAPAEGLSRRKPWSLGLVHEAAAELASAAHRREKQRRLRRSFLRTVVSEDAVAHCRLTPRTQVGDSLGKKRGTELEVRSGVTNSPA